MIDKKDIFFIGILLIGILSFSTGLILSIQNVHSLVSRSVFFENYNWILIPGLIFILIGVILLISDKLKIFQKSIRIKILEIVLITVLITSSVGTSTWLYGQYQKTLLISSENIQKIDEQLKMWDHMEKNNPFYSKKIVIRDDDVGDSSYLTSLEWISNLCLSKDIKIVLAIIPFQLVNNSKTVEYLNQLNREHFEFATHGYEHTHFQGLTYQQQYSLIENGTNIILEKLNYKPFTFVPPQDNSDVNTTKALRIIGYHSITNMRGYPSYVIDFKSDFTYEKNYIPPKHHSFEEFKNSYDNFINSSDEYFILVLHDRTFLNNEGELNQSITSLFENMIGYIKTKNIQFMTIEDCYQWYIDESIIQTGMINNQHYFIDLKECSYNHTIKFNVPSNWSKNALLLDITASQEKMFNENVFEFKGIKGHLYEITKIEKEK